MTTEELEDSPDFYFKTAIYDILLLLGCDLDIAKSYKATLDKPATLEQTQKLQQYAIYLFSSRKAALRNLNTVKIQKDEQ